MKVRDIKAFRVTVTFLLALPMTALANDDLSINGFLSVGASKSDADAVYYEGIVDEISFEPDTVVGVQLSAPVTETVSFTTQLLASGNKDTYDLAADWAYVDFSVGENTSIRAGRVKLPVLSTLKWVPPIPGSGHQKKYTQWYLCRHFQVSVLAIRGILAILIFR